MSLPLSCFQQGSQESTLTLDNDIKTYLQALSEQLTVEGVAEALGFAKSSHRSVRRVFAQYGIVDTPERPPDAPGDEVYEGVVWVSPNRATRRKMGFERAVILSDVHIPYHDSSAVGTAFAVIADICPDVIFIAGDLVDFFSISKYEKDPFRKLMLNSELQAARQFLQELRELAPDARIIYVQGNHEMRLEAYLLDNAPLVEGLANSVGARILSFESLMELDSLGIEYERGKRATKTAYVKYGDVLIGHFDAIGVQAGDTAKRLLNKYRQPVVQGHCHRLALVPYTHPDGSVLWGVECGMLGSTDPEYIEVPNWQQGLVVLTRDLQTDTCYPQLVHIEYGTAMFNDVVYTA